MFHSKIEAAPLDLFSAFTFDGSLSPKDKPRLAQTDEIKAYMMWQRDRSGLVRLEGMELQWIAAQNKRGQACRGATFGQVLSGARGIGKGHVPATYEAGAYSIVMPGANQREMVTMETLDDSGAVISSSTLPVDPKKRGIVWKAETVRAVAGPVAKPAPKRAAKGKAPIGENTSPPPIGAKEPARAPWKGAGDLQRSRRDFAAADPLQDALRRAEQAETMLRALYAKLDRDGVIYAPRIAPADRVAL